jgi:hypothetical protein
MVIALLAPEVLLYLAINERIRAGVLLKKGPESSTHIWLSPECSLGCSTMSVDETMSKEVSAQGQDYVIM